ncbi:MAG: hypothetical protein ACI9XP_000568 [Lentimonas sp.]|jgi:hypothetical protein
MSYTDKQLEEMSRKVQEELSFEYKSSYWKEMEAMLPAKRVGALYYWLTGAAAAGMIVLFTIGNNANMDEAKLASQAQDVQINSSNNPAVNTTSNTSENKPIENNQLIANDNQLSRINNTKSSQPSHVVNSIQLASSSRDVSKNTAVTKRDKVKTSELATNDQADNRIDEIWMKGKLKNLKLDIQQVNNEQEIEENTIGTLDFKDQEIQQFNGDFEFLNLPISLRKWSAYIEAGVTCEQVYIDNQPQRFAGTYLGGGFIYQFNDNWSVLGGGALRYQQTSLNLYEESKVYGFTSDEFSNSLLYSALYYFDIPLNLNYTFKNNHFQLGMISSYLMGTRMNYKFIQNGFTAREEVIYGEKKGWKSLGLKAQLGYGVTLVPTWMVGMNIQYHLTNAYDKNVILETTLKPITGTVFIRKMIK